MPMHDSTFLTDTTGSESVIQQLLSQWDAPLEAHLYFRHWAAQMAAAHLSQLQFELERLHTEIAFTLLQDGYVDEALVCRRAFVVHLLVNRAG